MNILENIRTALTGIWSNKMRSVLTMLGIIIGVFAVITIVTIGNSMSSSFNSMLSSMGASNIMVNISQRPSEDEEDDGPNEDDRRMMSFYGMSFLDHALDESDKFTQEMLDGLEEAFPDTIRSVQSSVSSMGAVRRAGNTASINALGANKGYMAENELTMLAGSNLDERTLSSQSARRVAVVSDKLVNKLFKGNYEAALGQTIEIETNGTFFEFAIVGVYEYKAGMFAFDMGAGDDVMTEVYVPLYTLKQLLHMPQSFEAFQITAAEGADVNALMADVKAYFEPYYRKNQYFMVDVGNMASMLEEANRTLALFSVGLSAIAGISLLVGGIGVMNIMLVSVSERTKEIGTRKALGANNAAIRIQFIVEAMMICLIGGAIGVALGVVTGDIISKKMGFEAATSAASIIVALLFSMSIGMFFGFYPANRAAKMNPVDALRYE